MSFAKELDSTKKMNNRFISALKLTLRLQPVIFLYAIASVCSKICARYIPFNSYRNSGELLNFLAHLLFSRFTFFLIITITLLGGYAFIWQRVIKNGKLSVIYANKASELFWSQIAAFFLFSERFVIMNYIGVIIIFCGIIIANSETGDN